MAGEFAMILTSTPWKLLVLCVFLPSIQGKDCPHPGHGPNSWVNLTSHQQPFPVGTVANFTCDPGFELLTDYPLRRCQSDGNWTGKTPMCAVNVAHFREISNSSLRMVSETDSGKLVDGYYSTCMKSNSHGSKHAKHFVEIDLLEEHLLDVVRIVFGNVIRDESLSLYYRMKGAEGWMEIPLATNLTEHKVIVGISEYFSYTFNLYEPVKTQQLRIEVNYEIYVDFCEISVFSSTAFSSHQCHSVLLPNTTRFEVHDGKCYSFHRGEGVQLPWEAAKRECRLHNGQLVTHIDKTLQKFFELSLNGFFVSRIPTDNYWIGGRETVNNDTKNTLWTWHDGRRIGKFFGAEIQPRRKSQDKVHFEDASQCLALSEASNWNWSSLSCNSEQFYICMSEINNCGTPALNPGSALELSSKAIFAKAYYTCAAGHLLNGLRIRECDFNGQWYGNEPTCKLVDCGMPPNASDVDFYLINGTTYYGSRIQYVCLDNSLVAGEDEYQECIIDDTGDQRWSGSVPTCKSATASFKMLPEYWVPIVGAVIVILVLLVLGIAIYGMRKKKQREEYTVHSQNQSRRESMDTLDQDESMPIQINKK